MPLEFEKTALEGVFLVRSCVFSDSRGSFVETFKRGEFLAAGLPADFAQDNYSRSVRGVVRGLHYQRGAARQGKLLRCAAGAVLDVGVDIRRESPTFGRWIAWELSAENNLMLYLPPGFAHGFLTLSETAELQYKCTAEYSRADEGGIRWNDPELGIDWGIKAPLLSVRDAALPLLRDAVF